MTLNGLVGDTCSIFEIIVLGNLLNAEVTFQVIQDHRKWRYGWLENVDFLLAFHTNFSLILSHLLDIARYLHQSCELFKLYQY